VAKPRKDRPQRDDSNADLLQFELLESYQCAIDARDESRRIRLRQEHPELAGLFQGLDRLAGIASVSEAGNEVRDDTIQAITPSGVKRSLLEPGDQPYEFGRYLLVEKLGQGGMGVVFRAREPGLAREVAIKVIVAGELATTEEVSRFQQEARAVAGLRHPHIVSVHDVGCADGLHFFTMDFMAGGSLANRLRTERFSIHQAALVMLKIAQATAFLHQHGIIHRDIKPSNILFDRNDSPCLTDFGLAKIIHEDSARTRTGEVLGTASYMSPEQATGAIRFVSFPSDVFGLGAVLYEMLTGVSPFAGENFLDTLLRVIERDPIPPRRIRREVHRDLQQICLRCLEKNPKDRYPTAAALANDLAAYLRGDPVGTQSSDVLHALRRSLRRYPAMAAHLIVLAAVAAIVAVRNWLVPGSNPNHLWIQAVLLGWVATSLVLQGCHARPGWIPRSQLAWTIVDLLLITVLIHLSESPKESLLVAYSALVAASGLWVKESLVFAATLTSLVGYAVLLYLEPAMRHPVHHPLIFSAVLVCVGLIVGFQVRRMRILSRFA
jgi:eukaryotic-like serine/threonine-protein kinase